MLIQFNTPVGVIADKAAGRWGLGGVMVSKEGYAAATNGRSAALVHVTLFGQPQEDCLVPNNCIPTNKTNVGSDVRLEDGKFIRHHKRKASDEGEFVDARYPKVNDVFDVNPREDSHLAVSIDAKMLWELAQAINKPGETTVTLMVRTEEYDPIKHNGSAIPVVSNDTENIGVIMPAKDREKDPFFAYRYTQQMGAKHVDAATAIHNAEVIRRTEEANKAEASA